MAGRPRTDIGTYGTISIREIRPGVHEARARFRLRNGRLKPVSRRGKTGPAAERKLKKALADMADEVAGKDINGDTRLTRVMDLWLAEFTEDVQLGKRAEKSLYEYRDTINNHLRPLMGELTCREAEHSGLVNETLKEIRRRSASTNRSKNGEAGMLRAKTVLSNVCTCAVIHGAMRVNPVKGIKKIDRVQEEVRALTPEELPDFLTKFRIEVERRVAGEARGGHRGYRPGQRSQAWTDLPEMVEGMLSTGLRPGELLALTDEDVLLDDGLVLAFHHLVRIAGQGMIRKPKRKGNRPGLKAAIVSWAAPMWRRRKLAAAPGGPLFAAWNGGWLDPGNVARRVREVCDEIGYGWVSARYFRHTTASHLTDAGLPVHVAADALGNTPKVVEKHYRAKRVADPRVAVALESMRVVADS